MSLRWIMVISFGGLFVITLLLVTLVRTFGIPFTSDKGSYGLMLEDTLNDLGLMADMKKDRLSLWITERRLNCESLVQAPITNRLVPIIREKLQEVKSGGSDEIAIQKLLIGSQEVQSLCHFLQMLKTTYAIYHKIQVVERNGCRILASTNEEELGATVGCGPPCDQAVQNHLMLVTSLMECADNQAPLVVFSMASQTSHGTSPIIVILYVNTGIFMGPLLQKGATTFETAEISLVDQDTRIVAGPEKPLEGGRILHVFETKLTTMSAKLATQGRDGVIEEVTPQGAAVISAYRSIEVGPGVFWGIIVQRERSAMLAPLYKRTKLGVLISIVGVLLAGLVALLLSNKINKPIEELILAAEEIESGNLTARVPVHGKNELAFLATTFNKMVDKLEMWNTELAEEVATATKELTETNKRLMEEVQARKKIESALLMAQRIAQMGNWEWNITDNLLNWSDEMYRIFGLNPKETGPTYESFLISVHPEDRDIVTHSVDRALRERQPYNVIHRIVRPDGEERYVHEQAEIFHDEMDRPIKMVGVVQDITDLKKSEFALLESERKYSRLFEDSMDSIFSTLRDGTIIEANDSLIELFGYTRQEIIGMKSRDLYADYADRAAFQETIERIGYVRDYEVKLKKRDGQIIHGSVTVSLASDNNGATIGYQGILRDVTEQKSTEKALGFQREQFLSIFDSINQIIYVMDPENYHVLYANKFASKLFKKDIMGGLCYEQLHGFSSPCEFCPNDKVINLNGDPYNWEFTLKDPLKHLMIMDRMMKWPDGRDVKFEMAIDITDRKIAEEGIKKSEALLNLVLEMLPIGVWITDEKGTLVRTNLAGREIWAGAKYVGPDEYGEYKGWWFETGKLIEPHEWAAARAIAKGETSLNEIVEIECFDGTHKIIYNSAVPVRDTAKDVIGTIIVNQDITDRIHAEQDLKSSEERMRTVIEGSPVGISFAQDGKYQSVNQAFIDIFGYDDVNEVIGQPLETLYTLEERNLWAQQNGQNAEAKLNSVFYERKGLKKNGQPFDAAVWLKVVEYKRRPAELGFVIDISEQKKLRLQLIQAQKQEALGTLAGGIAHDFNNILFGITGFTELAIMGIERGSKPYMNLERALNSADRARDMVKQILLFSRQDEQQQKPISVGSLVKESMKFMRSTIPTSIEIRLNIEPDLKNIMADPTQIHQVLMNLCINASHAMDNTGFLTVELYNAEVDNEAASYDSNLHVGRYVKLSVGDTGQGMTPGVVERIFDPYFTTKEEGKGTGLGLSVVHAIVKSHGGVIKVHSQVGKGSTFEVYFPAISPELGKETSGHSFDIIPTGTERILVVDDEEALVDIIKDSLVQLGYDVTTTTSSVSALELFTSRPDYFDLVLTDMAMPNIKGTDLATKIKAIRPETPIILCTGFSQSVSEDSFERFGISALIMKPILRKDLAQTVRAALDRMEP